MQGVGELPSIEDQHIATLVTFQMMNKFFYTLDLARKSYNIIINNVDIQS